MTKPSEKQLNSCPLYEYRFLPDKAIDVIDEASAEVRLRDERLVDRNAVEQTWRAWQASRPREWSELTRNG